MLRKARVSVTLTALGLTLLLGADTTAQTIRVGIIGLDTSHSPAFARLLNDSDADPDIAGFRVVAAYPHGSADIESSVRRIPQYTEEVQALGVAVVGSIDALLEQVDVVLLETNDGRPHLEQALQVIEAGKPLFIDKPIAGSLVDAVKIFHSAQLRGTPVFSTSSLRFLEVAQAIKDGAIGDVLGADTYSPAPLEPSHPDLFWYGIHGVETLYTVLGTGCETVQRYYSDGAEVVVGRWSENRIGTFRGLRDGRQGYGGTVFGTDSIVSMSGSGGYRPLMVEIARFFRTGIAPVSPEETLEIYAFMEAAHESKRRGGAPVSVAQVLDEAAAAARR